MNQATRTPVDSIVIPPEYVDLCYGWHGGIDCLLYAVSSTDGLTRGNRRPLEMTDEQWYLTLWRDLACDVTRARWAAGKAAESARDDDFLMFVKFEKWADDIVDKLTEEYGLADWEV